MRPTRLALLATVLIASPPAPAVTQRSDPRFVYGGHNQPYGPEGGVSCPGILVGSLPATLPGNTCTGGGVNTLTTYTGTCTLPAPYPGPEDIYQLNLGAGNNVAFSADLTGSTGDLALLVLGTCGDGTSCVANSADLIGIGVGPEVIAAASYAAGDYYVYVDSYYAVGQAGNCGSYTLSITGTLPVELLDDRAARSPRLRRPD